MTWAPWLMRETEIQISQGTGHGDVTNGLKRTETCSFFFKHIHCARDLTTLQIDISHAAFVLRQG
jgi:hypothetical protein